MAGSIVVVGFGNPLMGDDGFGHSVVAALQSKPRSPRCTPCFGDTLRLLGLWNGEEHLWAVDVLVRGATPGAVQVLEHDEVMNLSQRHGAAHHLSLPECLRTLQAVVPEMHGVRYRLFAVEPLDLGAGRTLSPPVAAAVPEITRLIQAEFEKVMGLTR
jgi:hydrogenase maturation protease